MSQQFGMRMPGGRARSAPEIDIYTGLMFIAVVLLLMATVVVYLQGSKLGKDGQAWSLQEDGRVQLPQR